MDRFCIFNAGSHRVALPMTCVRETVQNTELVPMVLAPEFVRGLFALRGEILSVLDLAPFVGAPSDAEPDAADTLLVVEQGGVRFAVPVTRVSTAEVDTSLLEAHPQSAIYPVLEAQSSDASGAFHILQFDRLQSSLRQAMGFQQLTAA
jgi:chemotaxis signal transduction protein